jgi:hypothetical protein
MVAPGWPLGRPGLRPVFFRSDFGAGLPGPSDDGGLPGFSGFCLACAARSATCARNSSSCPVSASICVSFAASSSRSRAFAARRPAFTSSSSPASPGAAAYRAQAAHWQSRPSAGNTTRKAGRQGISPGTGVPPEQTGN